MHPNNNTYHRVLYGSNRLVPESLLKDTDMTLCIDFSFENNTSVRVYPTALDQTNSMRRTIILLNLTPEDITYLTLLGVRVIPISSEIGIYVYSTILKKGIFNHDSLGQVFRI